jgi:biotin transport system substrate-specific component
MSSVAVTSPNIRVIAKRAAITIAGIALITLCAKIHVPFWPVPMTLHTIAVMAIALAGGPRVATGIFLGYLAAGAVGIPVFSGTPERGIGLAYMVGPTGGYLAGYLAASWISGALARGRNTLGRIGAMLAGLTVTYALGLAWLVLYVPARDVVALGFTPFILGDLVNIGIVAALAAAVPARFLAKTDE